jgi:hypothetical protein
MPQELLAEDLGKRGAVFQRDSRGATPGWLVIQDIYIYTVYIYIWNMYGVDRDRYGIFTDILTMVTTESIDINHR